MARTETIAAALIAAELPNQDVAAVVAQLAKRPYPVKMPTATDPEVGAKLAKKNGVCAAVTQAMSQRDAAYLSKAARDQRITVRREVGANPATAQADLEYLFEVALSKQDSELLAATVSALDLAWVVSRCGSIPWRSERAYMPLAERLVESGSIDLCAEAVAKGDKALTEAIGYQLAEKRPEGIDITKLISEAHEDDQWYLVSSLVEHVENFDLEIARLAVAHPGTGSCNIRYGVSVSDEAAELLISSGNDHMHFLAARIFSRVSAETKIKEELIVSLVKSAEPNGLTQLREISMRGYSSETAALVAEVLGREYVQPNCFLGKTSENGEGPAWPVLDRETLLLVLSCGNSTVTAAWLMDNYQQTPRDGEITAAVEVQLAGESRAFTREYSGYHYRSQTLVELTREDIARNLTYELDFLVSFPWADEIVDALGAGFFNRLNSSNISGDPLASYLATRLAKTIGVAPSAWRVAFGLLDEFEGSVADLISMTKSLLAANGESPELLAEETIETGDVEQLALL